MAASVTAGCVQSRCSSLMHQPQKSFIPSPLTRSLPIKQPHPEPVRRVCSRAWTFTSQFFYPRIKLEDSPGLLWLRLCTFTAAFVGSIPGWGIKILQGVAKKRKKKALLLNRRRPCSVCLKNRKQEDYFWKATGDHRWVFLVRIGDMSITKNNKKYMSVIRRSSRWN